MSRVLSNLIRLPAWWRRQRYQRAYPGVTIGMGAVIAGDTKIGEGSRIGDGAVISASRLEDRVSVYSGCRITGTSIGRCSYVVAGGLIHLSRIGRFCSIGPSILCGYGEHPTDFVSTSPVFFSTQRQCGTTFADRDYFEEVRPIEIGNDVWIGARVFVRDGIRIGDGAIVGAGAVVVKNVPDYAIVGGVPARLIRMRYENDIIDWLLKTQWWNWSDSELRQAQPLFAQNDIRRFMRSFTA